MLMIYTFSMLATLAGMGEGRQGYTGTPSITCSNTTPLPQTPRPHVCDACWPRQAAALAPTPHQHDNHHMGTAHRLSPPPPPRGLVAHTQTHIPGARHACWPRQAAEQVQTHHIIKTPIKWASHRPSAPPTHTPPPHTQQHPPPLGVPHPPLSRGAPCHTTHLVFIVLASHARRQQRCRPHHIHLPAPRAPCCCCCCWRLARVDHKLVAHLVVAAGPGRAPHTPGTACGGKQQVANNVGIRIRAAPESPPLQWPTCVCRLTHVISCPQPQPPFPLPKPPSPPPS